MFTSSDFLWYQRNQLSEWHNVLITLSVTIWIDIYFMKVKTVNITKTHIAAVFIFIYIKFLFRIRFIAMNSGQILIIGWLYSNFYSYMLIILKKKRDLCVRFLRFSILTTILCVKLKTRIHYLFISWD